MPFVSKRQMQWLLVNKPDVAKQFAEETDDKDIKKLPNRVRKPKDTKNKKKPYR